MLNILRADDLCQRLKISISALSRLRRTPGFPEPVQITDGVVGWREADLETWLSQRPTAVPRTARPKAPASPAARRRAPKTDAPPRLSYAP